MGVEAEPDEQHQRRDQRAQELPDEFLRSAESLAAPAPDLQQVIDEADSAEAERDEDRDPYVGIADVGEQDRREQERSEDQQTAHGRRAGLLLMGLRNNVADSLAEVRGPEALDQRRAHRERQRQRGEPREHRAKGLVAQDVEHG